MENPNNLHAINQKLKQEIQFLGQKIEYQQELLNDERKVTDNLISNKNRAIEALELEISQLKDSLDQANEENDKGLSRIHEDFLEKLEREQTALMHEKAVYKMEMEEQLNQFKMGISAESNRKQAEFENNLHQVRESHRKELRKVSVQYEESLKAVMAAHKAEITSIKEEAKRAIESAQKKSNLTVRMEKKSAEEQLGKMQTALGEKDQEISVLKQRVVTLSRSQDKKKEEAVKEFEKKLADITLQNEGKVESVTRSLKEMAKKLEQRCYRLESEKNSQKQQLNSELERLEIDRKKIIDQKITEKNLALEELGKEFALKLKERDDRHEHNVKDLRELHEMELKQIADQMKMQNESFRKMSQNEIHLKNKQISDMEKEIQKLRMQTTLQDSFWRKKERSTIEDTTNQVGLLKQINTGLQESHTVEIEKLKGLVESRERDLQEKESQKIVLMHQISSLKKEMEVDRIDHQKLAMNMEQNIHELKRQVSHALSREESLIEKIRYLEKDISLHLDTIDELRETIKELETRNQILEIKQPGPHETQELSREKNGKSPIKFVVGSKEEEMKHENSNVTWMSFHEDQENRHDMANKSILVDISEDELLCQEQQQDDGVDETFENVRKDLQDVIQSHIERIESLAGELQRTNKAQ